MWWKDCATTRRVNQSARREYRPRQSSSGATSSSTAGKSLMIGTNGSKMMRDWIILNLTWINLNIIILVQQQLFICMYDYCQYYNTILMFHGTQIYYVRPIIT